MNAQEFKKKFLEIIERDFPSFEANKILDDSNTFCDWVDVFLAWMEFGTLEECQECYEDNGE